MRYTFTRHVTARFFLQNILSAAFAKLLFIRSLLDHDCN